MSDFDWLDGEQEGAKEIVDAALDKVAPAPIKPRRKRRPAELIKAEKSLTPAQRYFARCLLESETIQQAQDAFRRSGYRVNRTTLYRWRKQPKFIKVLHLMQNYLFESLGIDKAKVMLDAEKIKENALTPRPILYKGEETGYDEIELGAALRALELQAKGIGIGTQESQRVVVAIDIDFTGRKEEPVDAEFEVIDG